MDAVNKPTLETSSSEGQGPQACPPNFYPKDGAILQPERPTYKSGGFKP